MAVNAFNISAVIDHFEGSLVGSADVNAIRYVNAFEELSRLFAILGMVFSFVESDVAEKRCILQKLFRDDPVHYETIEGMLRFECFRIDESTGEMLRIEPKNHGSRTLLRLHRASAFVIKFVEGVEESQESSLTASFKSAYRETLAHHHSWFVRQSVSLASHTIPNRERLIKEIFAVSEKPDDENHRKSMSGRLVRILNRVYERVENLYKKMDLLGLP